MQYAWKNKFAFIYVECLRIMGYPLSYIGIEKIWFFLACILTYIIFQHMNIGWAMLARY